MTGYSEVEARELLGRKWATGVYRFLYPYADGYIYRRWDGENWYSGYDNNHGTSELEVARKTLGVKLILERRHVIASLRKSKEFTYICDAEGNRPKDPKKKQTQMRLF